MCFSFINDHTHNRNSLHPNKNTRKTSITKFTHTSVIREIKPVIPLYLEETVPNAQVYQSVAIRIQVFSALKFVKCSAWK